MAATKKYADAEFYERKLEKVMSRFGVERWNWDYSRAGAWVEFNYKGQLYRFDYTVDMARENGQTLTYGSDCFAQIVLALEDLARIVERGIYELQYWVAGMKALPQQATLPSFCAVLGLKTLPTDKDELHKQYRMLAKRHHTDGDGTDAEFLRLAEAYEDAKKYLESL